MIDARRLLDTVVGALAQNSQGQQAGARTPERVGASGQAPDGASGGLGSQLDQAIGGLTGGRSTGDLAQQARDFMGKNPGMTQAALAGLAGLLLTGRKRSRGKSGGIVGDVVKAGGVALIGGLAYKAFQNYQAGKPLLGGEAQPQPGATPLGGVPKPAGAALPRANPSADDPTAAHRRVLDLQPNEEAGASSPAGFNPASASDDDAMLYVRAMVAAATADGSVDQNERTRILGGLNQAGLDAEATRWLETEMAAPASVDELAAGVTDPDRAARVYTAARVAIDPDTLQEREFLRQLADSLDLDRALVAHIDAAADAIRAPA